MRFSVQARMTAEFVGTALLFVAVVGSGIMGEQLSGGNVAIALLANAKCAPGSRTCRGM
jgi:glycerol uptake facilitator-like aquaporin